MHREAHHYRIREQQQRYSKSQRRVAISLFAVTTVCSLYVLCIAPFRSSPGYHDAPYLYKVQRRGKDVNQECGLVHSAPNKCTFVRENCFDEEAGLVSYLGLYFCKLHNAKPVAMGILLLWLGLLFSTIGIAASDFFSINLSTIATLLGLSESVAGVTFLAFGNGSPDVFSTFAAMSTHSGSLAIGELIGAAGFITAIVAGSMAIVRPFKVAKKSFVRDVSCFIAAASFSMVFLADGHLSLWECAVMVAFYIFYVVFVVMWQWVLGRNRRRKQKEARARGHFSATENLNDNIDDDDEETHQNTDQGLEGRRPLLDDFSVLESIGQSKVRDFDDEDQSEAREQWMNEINRNMRVQRPAPGPHRNTGNPIRPSLVGALEFRAVLSSLEKSRSQQSIPIGVRRRYSDDPTYTLAQQQNHHTRGSANPEADQLLKITTARNAHGSWHPYQDDDDDRPSRIRAVSANDAYALQSNLNQKHRLAPSVTTTKPSTGNSDDSHDRNRQSSTLTVPGQPEVIAAPHVVRGPNTTSSSEGLTLDVPVEELSTHRPLQPADIVDYTPETRDGHLQPCISRTEYSRHASTQNLHVSPGTAASSPAIPFPPYHDDPNFVGPPSRTHSIRLPSPSIDTVSFFPPVEGLSQRPLRWWPYRLLPSPSVLISTLFPTLYFWNEKTFSERILGIIAAPTVLLLTITLPVVEPDKESNVPGPIDGQARSESLGSLLQIDNINNLPSLSVSPETDGQGIFSANNVDEINGRRPTDAGEAGPALYTTSGPEFSTSVTNGWNRWLVSTQIFTAPLFVALIVWANTDEQHSPRRLLFFALCSLTGSLVVFAMLLLTTTDHKPPKYRPVLSFVGFVVSVAWISTIAGEVVGVLKALGIILGISDAILGLTIFAVGNSLGDLVADITVAKLGFPVMALSACFGGPMLNILLGIGLSGMYMTIKEGNRHQHNHPDKPIRFKPYRLEVSETLLISGVTLLVTLVGLLVFVPLNGWKMDRKIGWSLVALWCISTIANVVVEVTGVASQIS